MGIRDSYGNVLSTSSDVARDQYDRGVSLFLGANYGAADAFAASVAADPGFALGHAGHARALMMGGDMPGAKAALHRAEAAVSSAAPREAAHVAALGLLLSGQPAATRAAVREHVREHPRDAMAAQLCCSVFGLIGFSGEVGREAELLAYTEALLPHYGDDWWIMSMHAMSLCETGRLEASQTLMAKSLTINPRNANAAHFKAHAHYEAGETAAGRAYLSDWIQAYDDRSALHGHLSWHLALWALHAGDEEGMWEAVDTGVRPGAAKGLPLNTLTDTAAIYYRAELAGYDVAPERWAALSDYAAQTFPDPGQSFADIHAALSHAMAGEGERLARISESAKGFAGDLVRPVARAWAAAAHGHWQAVIDDLSLVLATNERLGGSRAQRDLIELTYVNALMRLGHTEEARRALRTRRPMLCDAPPVQGLH